MVVCSKLVTPLAQEQMKQQSNILAHKSTTQMTNVEEMSCVPSMVDKLKFRELIRQYGQQIYSVQLIMEILVKQK